MQPFTYSRIKLLTLSVMALSLFLCAGYAGAQDNSGTVNILPASSLSDDIAMPELADATHPPVRLTPDKSELIRLDGNAVTIIVGNPLHLSVLADSADTLVLVPKQPGATHFMVLDDRGEVIMQRHVIVGSPKSNYVRIRNTCAASENENCQNTSVYYCPDMCHQVMLPGGEEKKDDSGALDFLNELAEMGAGGGEEEDAGQ